MDINKICNKETIEPYLEADFNFDINIEKPVLGSDLMGPLAEILPTNYSYIINEFHEIDPLITDENIVINQIISLFYVNINSAERAYMWLEEFHEKTKTTMRQTRGHILKVKDKQGKGVQVKKPHSERLRNTGCLATIGFRIEKRYLERSHALEVSLHFTHNHVPKSAISLSFRPVNIQTEEKYLKLFQCGHTPSTARYEYEEKLHLLADNEEHLATILADRALNPDSGYIINLYKKFRLIQLGARNGNSMFERLENEIKNYNELGYGKAVFHSFDKRKGQAFVLCIVSSLMQRIHKTIRQAGEICYIDASSSFDSLNTSITLLYTSCAVGALPLGIILTSNESEDTLEFAFNFLKTILPKKAFYNRGPEVGPSIIITDDSYAERNVLRHCWNQAKIFLCVFHILQSFWRWLWNTSHHIHKDDRLLIMRYMKSMVYASTETELVNSFKILQQQYFEKYSNFATYVIRYWNRRHE
ncbi:5973_t:CDS:2, partial [Scutellospora calospora]